MTEHHLSINGDTVMLVLCEMGPDRYGDAGPVDSVVRVDSSLTGKEFTDTLIHELLHIAVPMASEAWVTEQATSLANVLHHPVIKKKAGFS